MNIAAAGSPQQIEELKQVISSEHALTAYESNTFLRTDLWPYDVVIDLDFDNRPESIAYYQSFSGKTLLLSSAKIQLEAWVPKGFENTVIGINAMPAFLGRKTLEACAPFSEMPAALIKSLGWSDVQTVGSRVGLVSPRIVCMIINEAYYTLQEGTAGRDDIDKGMKLGTAYPYGPFEWCAKIGVKNVYALLEAVYNDTKDERYKICSLLKTENLLEK